MTAINIPGPPGPPGAPGLPGHTSGVRKYRLKDAVSSSLKK